MDSRDRLDRNVPGEEAALADLRMRLQWAYENELEIAEHDLSRAVWFDGVPRPGTLRAKNLTMRPDDRRGSRVPISRRGPSVWFGLGAVALVAGLLTAAVMIPRFMSPLSSQPVAASQTASMAGTGQTPPGPSATIDGSRYSDGIPRTWDGQPVLRGQAALNAANQSTDSQPFLIAFWAGFEPVDVSGVGPAGTSCGVLHDVGDAPGVPSSALGQALQFDTTLVAPGPVIVRVHTHDPTVSTDCQHMMVGETAVWRGDAATAPHPWSVAQAANAFGVGSTPVADTCLGATLPGAAILQIVSATSLVPGIVAVFPSAEALAVAAPDASQGETDTPPPTVAGSLCPTFHDASGNAFRARWFARDNVLVGVFYNSAIAPDEDPAVVRARDSLDALR